MYESIDWGAVPDEETPIQAPYENPKAAMDEVKRYIEQLYATFGFLDVYFRVKRNPQSWGSYYTVEGCVDDDAYVDQLYFIDRNMPSQWLSADEAHKEHDRLKAIWEHEESLRHIDFPYIGILRFPKLARKMDALGIQRNKDWGETWVLTPDTPECQKLLWQAMYLHWLNMLDVDYVEDIEFQKFTYPYYVCAPQTWDFWLDDLFVCQQPPANAWVVDRVLYNPLERNLSDAE